MSAENVVELPIGEGGIGGPPKDLPADVQTAWDDVVSVCPPGLLIPLHRVFLELVSYTLARWRKSAALCETDKFATKRLLKKMLCDDCLISKQDAERLLNG